MLRHSVVALLLLHGHAFGQQAEPSRTVVPMVGSAAVTTDELGRPIAIGRDWECEFDATGARFLPVLGNRSPVLMDLRLRAAGLRRGPHEVAFVAEAEPQVRGERVCYRRAEGIVERFDATDAGLEHSLVIERPVGGSGDLVVTIALGGNAAAHGKATAGGGLCFSQGRGGVDYGTVTAIDARGARCAGELRMVPGAIEWVVPESFVARASYPLLLDPLIGSNLQLTVPIAAAPGSAFESDVDADLVHDVSTDTWLLVWQRVYSTGTFLPTYTTSIRGQRLDGNGAPVGSVLAISVVDSSRSPCVASVNPSNRFAVAWVQDFFGQSQVRLRAVNASDGVMSSSLFVVGQPQGQIEACDIAGESGSGLAVGADCWVCWRQSVPFGSNTLEGARVVAPANNGALSIAGTFTVAQQPRNVFACAPSCTKDGRIAFAYLSTAADVRVVVVDRAGSVVVPETAVWTNDLTLSTVGFLRDVEGVAIDGGSQGGEGGFVVAIDARAFSQQTFPFPTVRRLDAVSVAVAATATTVATVALHGNTDAPFQPSVAWRSGKALVAYKTGSPGAIVLRGIDPRTCATCEGPTTVLSGTSLADPSLPALALAGTVGEALRGLCVWTLSVDSVSRTAPLMGRRFDVFGAGASVTNLGGGCGGAGTPNAVGLPNVGNGLFRLQLLFPGAQSILAVLNVASPAPTLGCGACQWLPFESTLLLPVTSNIVDVPLPIPCAATLAGATVDTQWTVWRLGQAPCALVPDFVLSDIQRLNLR